MNMNTKMGVEEILSRKLAEVRLLWMEMTFANFSLKTNNLSIILKAT